MSNTRFIGGDVLAVIFGLFLRWCISLQSYSGQDSPPMYGDYEAQRHWMEITVNLPTKEWYFNTSNNDLMYWGLDYPPLTAYHSMVCGYVAKYFNPDFVKLHESRGYESINHKLFMRASVFISELLTFVPAICLYFSFSKSRKTESFKSVSKENMSDSKTRLSSTLMVTIALIYPGLILIDYGHFQFNCVSLGLFVFALVSIIQHNYIVSSIFFCLALSYKQMELYHSLPFFFYFLGLCYNLWQYEGFKQGLFLLFIIGSSVIMTFLLVWLPFLQEKKTTFQVLHRLFPIARGVFEDKVANFWCCLNVFYKIRNYVSNDSMAKICLFDTVFSVLPSCVDLFLNPTFHKFKLSLINSSLAFFLFSFQVHEKSILLVSIPILLQFPQDQFPCFWFLIISTFSMSHLFMKDNILIPYIGLTVFFYLFILSALDLKSIITTSVISAQTRVPSFFGRKFMLNIDFCRIVKWVFHLSMLGCLIITVCSLTLEPPEKYPDLYPLLISFYSFIHFLLFFIYFNFSQISSKVCVKLKIN
ncbi:hypothetical protein LSTR_LSTR014423 [Laodelphax striatellus]|uniref:Alpha-1,3-glucosyltransferase n=1 Tax=Laodelphax striatellus TaxID=195883 RepID=A0A482XTD6_LAOST|nr:hypothetical protein LSTR_LSTR014423 [Laodelphax striatellus]